MRKFVLFMLFITFVSAFESSAGEKDGGMGKGQIGITFSSFGLSDVVSFQKYSSTVNDPDDHASYFLN